MSYFGLRGGVDCLNYLVDFSGKLLLFQVAKYFKKVIRHSTSIGSTPRSSDRKLETRRPGSPQKPKQNFVESVVPSTILLGDFCYTE